MADSKTQNYEREQRLVIVVFDRETGMYSVDSGPWLKQGFVGPRVEGASASAAGSSSSSGRTGTDPGDGPGDTNEDIMRCLKSTRSGHVGHCHWFVWNGQGWVDTVKHGCSSC